MIDEKSMLQPAVPENKEKALDMVVRDLARKQVLEERRSALNKYMSSEGARLAKHRQKRDTRNKTAKHSRRKNR